MTQLFLLEKTCVMWTGSDFADKENLRCSTFCQTPVALSVDYSPAGRLCAVWHSHLVCTNSLAHIEAARVFKNLDLFLDCSIYTSHWGEHTENCLLVSLPGLSSFSSDEIRNNLGNIQCPKWNQQSFQKYRLEGTVLGVKLFARLFSWKISQFAVVACVHLLGSVSVS